MRTRRRGVRMVVVWTLFCLVASQVDSGEHFRGRVRGHFRWNNAIVYIHGA